MKGSPRSITKKFNALQEKKVAVAAPVKKKWTKAEEAAHEAAFKNNDLKINGGFPPGMTLEDFQMMAIVEVRWIDAPNQMVLLTGVDSFKKTYKGDRDFDGIDISQENLDRLVSKNPHKTPQGFTVTCPGGVHTQIVRLVARASVVMRLLLQATNVASGHFDEEEDQYEAVRHRGVVIG